MLRCVILAAVILLVSAIEERASLTLKGDNALVTQFPTIMTHDAATGMLDSKRKGLVNSYTQTQQDGTFADQLRCGARSFDFRPYLKKNGDVISHHGVMKIDTLMSDMMQEITDWLSEDQNSEELVILYVSHYDGDGDDAASKCSEAAESVLKDMGMTNIIHEDECAKLDSYTVGAAKQNGKLASGGSVLVVNQPCVSENYDPTVNCWGFSDKKEYSCFGKNKDLAWDSIAGYMNNTNWKKETGMWYVFKEGGCCTHETDVRTAILSRSEGDFLFQLL